MCTDSATRKAMVTVNQLNLTAVKFSFLTNQTYLGQENLAFGKMLFKKNNVNCLINMLFSLPFLKKVQQKEQFHYFPYEILQILIGEPLLWAQ